jgi:hypothetical protein
MTGSTPRLAQSADVSIRPPYWYDALVEVAHDAGCTLHSSRHRGVRAGRSPIVQGARESNTLDDDAALGGLVLGLERTLDQDVAYGMG